MSAGRWPRSAPSCAWAGAGTAWTRRAPAGIAAGALHGLTKALAFAWSRSVMISIFARGAPPCSTPGTGSGSHRTGAGGEVEQALPREVLDRADAERLALVHLLDRSIEKGRPPSSGGVPRREPRPPSEEDVMGATNMCRCLLCSTKMRNTSMTPMWSSSPTARPSGRRPPIGSASAPAACDANAASRREFVTTPRRGTGTSSR